MNEPRLDAEGRVVIAHRDLRGKSRDEILAIASEMLDEMIAYQIEEREIELVDDEGFDETALADFRAWAYCEGQTKKLLWLDRIRRRFARLNGGPARVERRRRRFDLKTAMHRGFVEFVE